MVKKRYPRDRGANESRRRPPAESSSRGRLSDSSSQPRRMVLPDPVYGEIPFVLATTSGPDGKVHEWWRPDPDYEPPLPPGAVRGNVHNQLFCDACHCPKYYYVDEPRSCIQCGRGFTFPAQEQKYWYERRKFNFSSVPVRCVACRRQRRTERALREQIARAKAHVRESPNDPAGHLAVARALVEFHQRAGGGDLNAAVAAARKAARLWPQSSQPLFWEGLAQKQAGRPAKARRAFEAFLGHKIRDRALRRRAEAELGELAKSGSGGSNEESAAHPSA